MRADSDERGGGSPAPGPAQACQPPEQSGPPDQPATRSTTPVSAAARRLQFRNGAKTFISGSTSSAPSSARSRTGVSPSRPSSSGGPALQRAVSLSTNPGCGPAPVPKGILVNRSRLQSATSVDVLDTDATPRALAGALAAALSGAAASSASSAAATPVGVRVKSAPSAASTRARKLKTVAARRGRARGQHSDSSDESAERDKDWERDDKEKDKDGKKDKSAARGSRRGVARTPGRAPSEVVTMVSLLSASDSPDDSDPEADRADSNLPPNSTVEADRQAPNTPALTKPTLTSSGGPLATGAPTQAPAAAPERKPPKSAQPTPSLGPGTKSANSLSNGGGALGVLHHGLTHGLGLASEKRAPSVEARTAKRRLTRAFSEPMGFEDCTGVTPSGLQIPLSLLLRATESHGGPATSGSALGFGHGVGALGNGLSLRATAPSPAVSSREAGVGRTTPAVLPRSGPQDEDQEDDGEVETSAAEPTFSTPKERECWELFKKMSDKGITVSYDTVLRGMLTPTEYRMRRNSLLTGC